VGAPPVSRPVREDWARAQRVVVRRVEEARPLVAARPVSRQGRESAARARRVVMVRRVEEARPPVAARPVSRQAHESAARARRVVVVRRVEEVRPFAAVRPVSRQAPEDAARAQRAAPEPEVCAVLAPMRLSRAPTPPDLVRLGRLFEPHASPIAASELTRIVMKEPRDYRPR
jgi:hypothetical protein